MRFGNAGLQLLMLALLARLLDPEEFGAFSSMFALGTLGAFVCLFGQHLLLMRMVASQPEDMARVPHLGWYLRTGTGFILAGALLASGVLFVLGWGMQTSGRSYGIILVGGAVFLFPMILAEAAMNLARARGSFFLALLPRDIIWRALVIAIALALLVAAPVGWSGFQLMLICSAALMACLFFQIWQTWKLYVGNLPPRGSPDWRRWRGQSLWLWLSSLAGNVPGNLAVLIVSMVLTLEEVGIFFAATRLSMILSLPLNALNIAVAPVFSQLHACQDYHGLQSYALRMTRLIALPAVAAMAGIAAFGDLALAWLDPEITDGWVALCLLAVGYTLRTLAGASGVMILMTGHERKAVQIFFLTEGLALLIMPTAAHLYGIEGAAGCFALGVAASALLTNLHLRRTLGVDPGLHSAVFAPRPAPGLH